MEKATLADLDEILELFDAVQTWLVGKGLKGQWGDQPFSASEGQRERFAAWLDDETFWVVRRDGRIVGTLVFSSTPPGYAEDALEGRAVGGYLEAFAVHRSHAGKGVGATLLAWAEQEAGRRGLRTLHLDCWADNGALRAYYRRAGFTELSTLALGAWRGVLFEKL